MTPPETPVDALARTRALETIIHVLGCPRWDEFSAAECIYRGIHAEDVERRGPAVLAALTELGWSVERKALREAVQKACDDHLGRMSSSEPFTAKQYRDHGMAAYHDLRSALRGGPDATD